MSLKAFKKIKIDDYATNQLQQNVAEFVSQIKNNPLMGGVLLQGVAVSTTPTEIAHGLGRPVVGYFIVKSNANVTVYDTPATTTGLLKLTASGTAVINLYVF